VDEDRMTANKNLKRRVRSRAAKTGESYAAALRHVRPAQQGETMPDVNLVRLAAAQVVVRDDPGDRGQVRQSGHDVRELMRQASRAGARIIHFPEGATCSPHKRIMSATGPAEVGRRTGTVPTGRSCDRNSRRSPGWPASSGCGRYWERCTR
jgi:hypothetical protein